MAAADHGGPVPELYRLLGVPRGASREEITQAWRRRARAEHPDSRPLDAAAPARFRALAEAYQVLGDPARRAAYDRALGYEPGPGAAASEGPASRAAWRYGLGVPVAVTPAARVTEPPLRAGPVWVERPDPVPEAASRTGEDDVVRLAVLAELALRYLARDRGRPW